MFNQGLATSTMTSKLSALSYYAKLKGVDDPMQSFIVQKALVGARKSAPSQDVRLPITVPILKTLMSLTREVTMGLYNAKLLKAMMALSFYTFLRPGEVTSSPHNIQFSSLKMFPDYLEVTFQSYKHSTGKPVTIRVSAQDNATCPVRALEQYISERGVVSGPLFCSHTLHPISYQQYNTWFNDLINRGGVQGVFGLHSFRLGSATHAALKGHSSSVIQTVGRWRSAAYQKYIRISNIHL